MKSKLKVAVAGVALVCATSASAQLTFYGQEGFRGRSFPVNATIENFDGSGFNDRASSVIVERGRWELCQDAFFRGSCTVLRPGQYPSLAAMGLNDRVSSVRRVRANAEPRVAYAPPPPAAEPYRFYPQHGERLFQADVLAVRAVVGPPEQRCWVEREQVHQSGANVPGAIIGGIIGGVIGHQIGSGRGNDVATAVGAVGGAAIGANVDRRSGRTYTQDVQRCASVPSAAAPAYYDVTYGFRGQTHRAQLAAPPGSTITVNGQGEPRV
ncbi:MAG TPA: beta/gamma crystallin family protein [Casimicrobiaceae bacterium]|nr:beta/gamma crystallin family protein [Casimicrobiaceae bacterium]